MGGVLLLAIAVLGILIMFGKAKPDQFYKFVVFLIFAPVFLAVGINHALWLWYGLPPWAQIISILLLPFLLSALLRILLPRAAWLDALQRILFETLVYAATFPFRFLWRAGRFALGREHHRTKLDPHRAVVGSRPPIQTERKKQANQNKPFD